MAAAFGAVANSGVYLEPYAFTEVRYADNQTVYLRGHGFANLAAGL